MKVLVTGASGFVGSHVVESMRAAGHEVAGTMRSGSSLAEFKGMIVADSDSDFSQLLEGFDAVVHAAGVAHNPTRDPLELKRLFDQGNREWTRKMAEAVAKTSVQTLIHISSIAAAGSIPANLDRGFAETDETDPETDYGRSKREAECFVTELEKQGKLGVNLRPPLIYGSGTKGNWAKIVSLARSRLPIPFATVKNQRSYLGIDNLTDLVTSILGGGPRADLSGTYHVADRGYYSLSQVVKALREGVGRRPGLLPFPIGILRAGLKAAGKQKMAEGLFEDLKLDTQAVETAFGWTPGVQTLDGMKRTMAKETSLS